MPLAPNNRERTNSSSWRIVEPFGFLDFGGTIVVAVLSVMAVLGGDGPDNVFERSYSIPKKYGTLCLPKWKRAKSMLKLIKTHATSFIKEKERGTQGCYIIF